MLGAVAGVAGAAGMVAAADPAEAANGDAVTVGGSISGSSTTQITTTGGDGMAGITSADENSGVFGQDTSSGATWARLIISGAGWDEGA
jgi:hypothetical protein